MGENRALYFFSIRYASGMDTEKRRELWDRLDGEPSRAYEAFRTFLGLPGGNRTMVTAYRQLVGNPDASKVSDAWNEWARRYAWKERAQSVQKNGKRTKTAPEKAKVKINRRLSF